MGSSVSSLLANAFMSHLEHKTLHSKLAKELVKLWFRYENDIVTSFRGAQTQINAFLNFLNSLYPKIKFTTVSQVKK